MGFVMIFWMFAVMKTNSAHRPCPTPHHCLVELREMLQSVLGDNFVRLYLYGSRVEGDADPESDYDVLCVIKRPLRRDQKDNILNRQLDIQMNYGVLFDLHFRHGDQMDSTSLMYTPYIDHVISEGIVI
jgi:predicted nucleotidyltransferase